MTGAGDFVRGTLVYLFNCAVAVFTLVGAALRLRPIRGALRCKAKQERTGSTAPDGRVMMFLACCLFGTICTYAAHGVLATLTVLARSLVDSSALPKSALVTATFFYFTCELAIHREVPRRLVPGRKGTRNREILRFLLASLLIQLALYEPIALLLLSRVSNISGATITGDHSDGTITQGVDTVLIIARLCVVMGPFLYLFAVLRRFKLDTENRDPLALAGLPPNLLLAALLASFAAPLIWPPAEPALITINCRTVRGEILVDALFRNDGDQYWTPAEGETAIDQFGVAIVGPAGSQPQDSKLWQPITAGEGPAPLIVGPHSEVHFRRRVFFGPTVDLSQANGCTLVNHQPWPGLIDMFRNTLPPQDLVWVELPPSNTKVGPLNTVDDDVEDNAFNASDNEQ